MSELSGSDRTLALLQERHPALLADISAYVQSHPDSRVWRKIQCSPETVVQGSITYLFDAHAAADVALKLGDIQGTLVHLFPEISRFLQFLSQEGAERCVVNARYVPILILPLENSSHLQKRLAGMTPRDWPWVLLESKLFPTPEDAERAAGLGRQLLALVGVLTKNITDALALRYPRSPAPAHILAEKVRPLKVMTIAVEGSSYQKYCARDMVDGLCSLGVEAEACIASSGPAHAWEIISAISRFLPDVLLLNGRGRDGFPGIPANLPVLSWDQDYMLSGDPAYARSRKPHDRLMVMVREWLDHARDQGVAESHVQYVNLGTNPRQYHPPTALGVEPEFDVLFVGNIYPFDQYRKLIGFDNLPDSVQQLMLHARERLDHWITARGEIEPFVIPDCDTFLRDCLKGLGLSQPEPGPWRFIVHYFRYRVAHLLVRERYLSALGEFRLGLFGRGWDRFPALAAQAQPEIENGPALRDAIHRSAINLHLHTWTVHHPRLYDTAAASGFLLVGRVPEQITLDSVFEVHKELDSFGSIPELKNKIRHYLDHPRERQAMAERAARRAASDHDMKHRMGQAVQLLAA